MDTNLTSLMEAKPVEESAIMELTLDAAEIQVAEMMAVGKTTRDIAQAIGRSVSWVRGKKKDPNIIQMVRTLQMEAVDAARYAIVANTSAAADAIVCLAKNGPPAVQLSAAKDILDRIGMRAPDKKQIEATVNVNISREERLANIKERLSRLSSMGLLGVQEVIDIGSESASSRDN